MIESSAIAKTCVVAVVCSVLSVFEVLLCLGKLVVSSEEIDQLGQNRVLVRLFFKHTLELLHGFLILIAF